MGLKNDLPVYADLCAPVNGRFMSISEREQVNLYLTAAGGNWTPTVIEPDNVPPDVYAYLEDGVVRSSVSESNEAIDAASTQVDNAGRHIMAVRCNQALVMLQIDATGIKKLAAPGIGADWPFEVSLDNSVVDFDISQRGEIAIRWIGNTLNVAHSGYWWEQVDPQNPTLLLQQTLVTYWKFNLSLGSTMGVTANFTPANVPNANPRIYSLDVYTNDAPPLDFAGNAITRPAVCGLEFSPNGRYIYFVKSPNFAYPNSGGDESNFGCIDLDWVIGEPGTYYSFLPIDVPTETRKLADTQMGINVGPEGSGTALYVIGADAVGEYWLGTFSDPDDPDPNNWQISPAMLGDVAFFNEITSPQTQFRFMPARVGGSTHYGAMNTSACCDELVHAHDRSTTISPDCDLTWQPGNNAFWNTPQPVYVATELRIEEGAHVVASNMHFRFGVNASFIIEKSASLKCTNCTFTNACDDQRWKGIIVEGTTLQHQFGPGHPTHQGHLELFASTVENAITGIRAAADPYYKTTAGALINCAAATVMEDTDGDGVEEPVWKRTIIRNCREGVKFYPYQNFNPNTSAPLQNLSRFNDCLFTANADFPGVYDFLRHAYLWHVDGIPFIACTFENTRSDGSFALTGSQGLGHGIYSLDANYRVLSACNLVLPVGSPPCPENQTRRSKFIGLDHGIHALKSITLRNFKVDRAEFTNNICGIYSSGVVGFVAKRNNFTLGGRNVALTNLEESPAWDERHRGIFSYNGYGFIIDDNNLSQSGDNPTEGIVVGQSRDHNDMVFRNHATNLDRGYIGEGQCVDLDARAVKGLHFQCNTNDDNGTNFWSRFVTNGGVSENQTIRTQQGTPQRVADNTFDQEAGRIDFTNDGCQHNIITYWWALPETPNKPIYTTCVAEDNDVNGMLLVRPANNCVLRILPLIPDPDDPGYGMALNNHITAQKNSYGTTRYLYDQLIDGGSTDEVVQEIMSSWPQEAWDLRAYLLSKSPYLSVEVLKDVVNKPGFPMAMKAEVCIANPDATKKEGFIKWLRDDANEPMPENLIGAIEASWNTKTYRTQLEGTMAHHHGEMTQAANMLLEWLGTDTVQDPLDSLRIVWQQVRGPGARYAEALSYLQVGEFDAAEAIVEAIPEEHRLKATELTERGRMLEMIAFLRGIVQDGRTDAELTVTEQDQLEAIVADGFDRPSTWAQNLLCFHYERCTPPMTGGDSMPKSLFPSQETTSERQQPQLVVMPNPATTWATFDYTLLNTPLEAWVEVKDIQGRTMERMQVNNAKGQLVWDTRQIPAGVYTVELINDGKRLHTEKLIVKP